MDLIEIIMVPYYVENLGIASYAIIPLATTMAAYIQNISDSIACASIRFNALAVNTGDSEKASVTLSSSFFGIGKIRILCGSSGHPVPTNDEKDKVGFTVCMIWAIHHELALVL